MTGKSLLVLACLASFHRVCASIPCAFVQTSIKAKCRFDSFPKVLEASKTSWSAADDWSILSSELPSNSAPDSETIFNKDIGSMAASAMEPKHHIDVSSEEDVWVRDTVDMIHHHGFYYEPSASDPKLYDTGFEDYTKTMDFVDDMGREISMLVHCNESPEELLIREGRALPPLTKQERDNVTQLVTIKEDGTFTPTRFFRNAVSNMFREHAVSVQVDGTDALVLNAVSIGRWISKSLGEESVGPHDKRVLATISKFGSYGTGYLTEENFLALYLAAVEDNLRNDEKVSKPASHYSAAVLKKRLQKPTIDSVWRDIRNHGLVSPVESERARLAEEFRAKYGAADGVEAQARGQSHDSLLDECEILEFHESFSTPSSSGSSEDQSHSGGKRGRKSSHELVVLSSDNETPKKMRDGDFVFIDEQTCIGCNQCAQISPSSFLMLEDGRARTYAQRIAPDVAMAVSACPVNCMHKVSFRELKEMEIARDAENWEDVDRRHLNHRRGNIPLHVSGMDSDANHRSSWYHYLKQKCHMSKDCPKRGCYDCPHFNSPGENPYFKALHHKAEHVRATDLSGSNFRKTAEL